MSAVAAPPQLRSKALAVLREGRLTVLHARHHGHQLSPHEVVARVKSSRGERVYAVDLLDGAWDCTCGNEAPCAHIAAAQLVAGTAP